MEYTKQKVIKQLARLVRDEFENDTTGHDWWHITRVWHMAKYIAEHEKTTVDLFVIDAASLLHEMTDWKFNKDEDVELKKTMSLLTSFHVQKKVANHIIQIIKNISFKGAHISSKMPTMEGKIVQDADRLDAIGAVGISRVFTYGGSKGVPIYDPSLKPRQHASFQEYKTKKSTSINHFYEKLFLLISSMNTKTGKQIAKERHEFMKTFLHRFFQEWKGKK